MPKTFSSAQNCAMADKSSLVEEAVRRIKILVSLSSDKNEAQREMSAVAQEVARKLDVDLEIVNAEGDAIAQSQQLLDRILSRDVRPDGVVCFPVGTGLTQVADAAARNGIGWAVLNRKVDYLQRLRATCKAPFFEVSVDMEEVGIIQGKQFAALLPRGGLVLYITGPTTNPGIYARLQGLNSSKPSNVTLRTLPGSWSEESGYRAVSSWLSFSTSRETAIELVSAQNDNMAMGARRALSEHTSGAERERWMNLPFTGVNACPREGEEWLKRGSLSASVRVPPTTGVALEMLVNSLRDGSLPPERTIIHPTACPAIEKVTRPR